MLIEAKTEAFAALLRGDAPAPYRLCDSPLAPPEVLAMLARESVVDTGAGDTMPAGAAVDAQAPVEPPSGLASILRLLQRRGQ